MGVGALVTTLGGPSAPNNGGDDVIEGEVLYVKSKRETIVWWTLFLILWSLYLRGLRCRNHTFGWRSHFFGNAVDNSIHQQEEQASA